MSEPIAHACYACGRFEGIDPDPAGDPRYVCDRCVPKMLDRMYLPAWLEAFLEDWRPQLEVVR